MRTKLKDNLSGYFFIAPWLICFLVFTLFPVGMSLYYSFTNFNLLSAPDFIGLENYRYLLFEDRKFWQSVKVTLLYAFVSIPLRLIFAFFVANLLAKKHRGQGIYRTLFYLPSIVGESVAVAIVWRTIFGKNGAFEALLGAIGITTEYSVLGDPSTAIWSLILMSIWQFGSPMLIFLAGLKDIPDVYYEAASIDGASSFQKFWRITVPLITPIFLFNLVMQMITGFMVFTQGYIITEGGPLNSTLFYVVYLYQTTFENFESGRGSAMAWLLLVFIGILTAILFSTSKYWVFEENEKEG
ncbi:MAG TPA: sugar ABC transporter permease [Candidatus Mediterraneibacter norfolkensis]|nr:sugar ABC transporter permease [Candidatus Mediterraneibacter norfolkensis]